MTSTHPGISKEAILEGIRQGDSRILNAVFKDYLPGITKFIVENNGTKADAEDIFMDALEAIYRRLKTGNLILTCAFYTYLFEICKRLWWKRLRRKKFDAGVTPEDLSVLKLVEEVEEQLEITEQFKLYREKLAMLKEDCFRLLHLFFQDSHSMLEIAKIMGYASEGYARKRKLECKNKLVDLIKSDRRFDELQ